jgi:hypothetical protein
MKRKLPYICIKNNDITKKTPGYTIFYKLCNYCKFILGNDICRIFLRHVHSRTIYTSLCKVNDLKLSNAKLYSGTGLLYITYLLHVISCIFINYGFDRAGFFFSDVPLAGIILNISSTFLKH